MKNNVYRSAETVAAPALKIAAKILPIRTFRGNPPRSSAVEEEWVRLNRLASTQPFCRIHRLKKHDCL
jgi:hypothetical protein